MKKVEKCPHCGELMDRTWFEDKQGNDDYRDTCFNSKCIVNEYETRQTMAQICAEKEAGLI